MLVSNEKIYELSAQVRVNKNIINKSVKINQKKNYTTVNMNIKFCEKKIFYTKMNLE